MNKILEGIHSRIPEAEGWISDIEDRMLEITATEKNIRKKIEKRWRQPKRLLGQHWIHEHSHYRGLRRRREKGPEKIFEEIIAENIPNMEKEIVNQIQEMQKIPGRTEIRRNAPRHIVIKIMKIKTKIKYRKQHRKNNK